MSARLELSGVSKTFGDLAALAPTDLAVEPGEIVTLLGPSGSGKTTLLRIAAGLEAPSTGTVTIDGAPPGVARAAKRIGLVPQNPALLPWRTVRANARLLTDVNRRANPPDAPDPVALLEHVGLGEFMDALPHELSGGMQQRVALVRAFALGSPLLLMDEPFAALDALTREQLYQDLQRIWQERRKTIIFVTHNVREAVCLGDRVIVFSPHPGRIREQFEVTLPRPRDLNSVELARLAGEITRALKSHLGGAGAVA